MAATSSRHRNLLIGAAVVAVLVLVYLFGAGGGQDAATDAGSEDAATEQSE